MAARKQMTESTSNTMFSRKRARTSKQTLRVVKRMPRAFDFHPTLLYRDERALTLDILEKTGNKPVT